MNYLFHLLILSSLTFGLASNEMRTITTARHQTNLEINPIHDHFDKEMKITSHKRGQAPVEHSVGDFMRFKEDKTYVQKYNGVTKRGKWAYNNTDKSITITLDEGGSRVFFIESSTATKVVLKKGIEVINLEP